MRENKYTNLDKNSQSQIDNLDEFDDDIDSDLADFNKKDVPKDIWTGAIAWMVQNNVAANLLMFAMLVGGFIFMGNMRQEVMPDFEMDTVTISLSYSGASPEDMEQGMVLAIEDAVRGLEDVKEVRSRVYSGGATIYIEAIDGVDRQAFLDDISGEIDTINTFPEEGEISSLKLQTLAKPVLTVVLYGSDNPHFLREWADIVRNGLLAKSQISQAELSNVPDKEIHIEIEHNVLRKYGLKFSDISSTINASSIEQSAGSVETSEGDINLKLNNRREYADEFAQLAIVTLEDGSRVYLEDIASVEEAFSDSRSWSEFNATPAISIIVYRVGNQGPKEVAASALEVIDYYNQTMPGDLHLTVQSNDADTFDDRISLLVNNAFMGIALVFVCLAIFLQPSLALWVSLGIPISIMGSFVYLYFADQSINMMSLFAFILTLGIVVDDAIVVGENVHIWKRRGYTNKEAAVLGTKEIAVPIVFSVLTNIVAFMPIVILPSMLGMLFAPIFPVVAAVFFYSLIESLYVLPCHLAHDKKPKKGSVLFRLNAIQHKFSVSFTAWVKRVYGPFLHKVLEHKYSVFAFCITLLIISFGFIASGRLGMEQMPRIESDYAHVEIVMPSSTSRDRLRQIGDQVYAAAEEVVAENGGDALATGIYVNVFAMSVSADIFLVDADDRELTVTDVAEMWQEKVGLVFGAETISFEADSGGPGSGKSFGIRLIHSDNDIIQQAAEVLAEELRKFPTVSDIDTGTSRQTEEYQVRLTPFAEKIGLTSSDVSSQMHAAFDGITVLRQQRGSDEITVRLRLTEEERSDISTFNNLIIRTPQNEEVLLSDVVTIEEGLAPAVIQRFDGQRIATVSANVTPRADSGLVLEDIKANALPELMSRFPGLSWGQGGMQEDIDESMAVLYMGLMLVLLAIYVLLAIPFKSYTQPMIIMVAIPFGVVGAIVGHIIMGYSMSVISIMGILALSGLVVNDSLVLIAFANNEKRRGLSAYEAVHNAGIRRFRPIMLTTITTFVGLMPLLLETSMQARMLIPVAISLGFGVVFATVITLVLVPALYLILDELIGH